MKLLMGLFVLLNASTVIADQDLKVVARNYSTSLKCETAQVDENYRDEHRMVEYTVCPDLDTTLKKIKADFEVVLKIEGLDSFSQTMMEKHRAEGNKVGNHINLRVIGVVE